MQPHSPQRLRTVQCAERIGRRRHCRADPGFPCLTGGFDSEQALVNKHDGILGYLIEACQLRVADRSNTRAPVVSRPCREFAVVRRAAPGVAHICDKRTAPSGGSEPVAVSGRSIQAMRVIPAAVRVSGGLLSPTGRCATSPPRGPECLLRTLSGPTNPPGGALRSIPGWIPDRNSRFRWCRPVVPVTFRAGRRGARYSAT